MRKIFFVETPSDSLAHGIGAYADNLLAELSANIDITIHYIQVRFSKKGRVTKRAISERLKIIQIEFESPDAMKLQEVAIPTTIARAIFCVISSELREGGENIFHINSVLQISIATIAKEYNYKLVFTSHVSLWRILYSNNEQKFIADWQSNGKEALNSTFIRSIKQEMKLCEICDLLICLTNDHKSYNINYLKIDPQKIKVIPNGLKSKKLHITQKKNALKQKLGYNDRDFIFLFVGRLIDQKGVTAILTAFKSLINLSNSIRLIVVGKGNIEKYLQIASTFPGRVTFTGYLPPERVSEFYRIADVGIMPSVTEQSSYVVLEMLSYKLPVILSDIVAFNDHFIHNNNVIKIKTNSLGQVLDGYLYTGMKMLFEDQNLRSKIASAGYDLYKNKFQASYMATATYAVYKSV